MNNNIENIIVDDSIINPKYNSPYIKYPVENNAEYIARHPTSIHKIPLGTAQVLLYPFSFLKSGRLTLLFYPGPPGLVFL